MEKTFSIVCILVMVLTFTSCFPEDENLNIDPLIEGNTYKGTLFITSQGNVEYYGSLNLETIEGTLSIRSQSSDPVIDLTPLNSIKNVGSLFIYNNSKLVDLTGLENIENLQGVSVEVNALLENINALNIPSNSSGGIGLVQLPSFNDYSVVSEIEEIGSLTLDELPLSNLSPFENLKKINRNLTISNMEYLENLNGLNIEYLGRDLNIIRNSNLLTIDGLETITDAGQFGELSIYLNPNLYDYCSVNTLIQDGYFSNDFSIWGNDYNPELQNLIEGDCAN
jgi:uncharacterized protein YkvS